MKTFTNLDSNQFAFFDTSLTQDCPVSFQTHSQCFDSKFQVNKQKKYLFQHVFTFIHKLIEDEKFYNSIRKFLTRHQVANQKNQNQMVDESEQHKTPLKNVSFKKMQITSYNCFQNKKERKVSEIDLVKERRCSKKISIVIFGNEDDQQAFSGSDSNISEQQLRTLRQIKLPSLRLTQQLIKDIYQAPSPFLMNLSLCLFLRYCLKRNSKPEWNQAAWILAISTIEAFKLYYDQELQGMFQCFENVLKISKEDLVDLQRCFLQKIDYNVIIQNYDYQFVLSKFVQMEKYNQKQNKLV